MFTDLVYIGRFQPLHNEHLRVIERALELSERVIIVLGSCNVPRSYKNPFTAEEREELIYAAVSDPNRVTVIYSDDVPYDWQVWEDEIIDSVHDTVLDSINKGACVRLHGLDEAKIGLLCPRKDQETSEYLDLFKCWEHVEVPVELPINATDIRRAIFDMDDISELPVPDNVLAFIENMEATKAFDRLVQEFAYIDGYKKLWITAPFPPMFITVDNVIIHRGKVLLVTRGGFPGNGLLALPGGFHENGQTLWNSALRELREETTLVGVEQYFVKSRVFDNPSRSQLGAMVTHAFYFVIPDELDVPLVKGEDDAAYADWYEIEALDPRNMHDDHFWIIQEAL